MVVPIPLSNKACRLSIVKLKLVQRNVDIVREPHRCHAFCDLERPLGHYRVGLQEGEDSDYKD